MFISMYVYVSIYFWTLVQAHVQTTCSLNSPRTHVDDYSEYLPVDDYSESREYGS
jgi:hypothetical protein